jgi:hypothetical protein
MKITDVITVMDTIASTLAHLAVFAAALYAIPKYLRLKPLSPRYKSQLETRHYVLSTGEILFAAEYTVSNVGERPISFSEVTLRLCAAKSDNNGLLSPDVATCFAQRAMDPRKDSDALFHIAAGERTVFCLRKMLPSLDAVSFVLCQLKWEVKGESQPAPYQDLYVRTDRAAQRSEEKKAVAGT